MSAMTIRVIFHSQKQIRSSRPAIGLRRSTKMAVVGRIDQGPAASAFDDPNCVPRTLARVCPQTFSLSWTSRAAQSDARRHGARPHTTAGSCFGGRLDWCRHLPSRCVSSRTVTTARSSHLCPPRAGRVPRPDPSNNATRPSRRPQPLGRCGRRDDVHAALPRRLRNATPRFPLRGPLALSLSPSREQARSAFGRETDRNLRVPVSTARLLLTARARQGELHPGGAPGGG